MYHTCNSGGSDPMISPLGEWFAMLELRSRILASLLDFGAWILRVSMCSRAHTGRGLVLAVSIHPTRHTAKRTAKAHTVRLPGVTGLSRCLIMRVTWSYSCPSIRSHLCSRFLPAGNGHIVRALPRTLIHRQPADPGVDSAEPRPGGCGCRDYDPTKARFGV